LATQIYETETVKLFSGKELELRPLKISVLRKFMKAFEGLEKASDDNDKSMDVLVSCAAIAMEQYSPDLADNREALEDELDLPTVWKIVEVAAGIKQDDPNPLAAGLSGAN
jgi:hypothetical protein